MLWAGLNKNAPRKITEDFDKAPAKLPGIDWNSRGGPIELIVSVRSGNSDHEIHGLGLAPLNGSVSVNYYRWVQNAELSDL